MTSIDIANRKINTIRRGEGRRNAAAPRCRLHGCSLTQRFPVDCPLAEPVPIVAIRSRLDSYWADRAEASIDAAEYDAAQTCAGCIAELAAHSQVTKLRRGKGLSSLRQGGPPDAG